MQVRAGRQDAVCCRWAGSSWRRHSAAAAVGRCSAPLLCPACTCCPGASASGRPGSAGAGQVAGLYQPHDVSSLRGMRAGGCRGCTALRKQAHERAQAQPATKAQLSTSPHAASPHRFTFVWQLRFPRRLGHYRQLPDALARPAGACRAQPACSPFALWRALRPRLPACLLPSCSPTQPTFPWLRRAGPWTLPPPWTTLSTRARCRPGGWGSAASGAATRGRQVDR